MTSMNVSIQPYVVAEQTADATTSQDRTNAAASDLTSLTTTDVFKVRFYFGNKQIIDIL